MAGNYFLICRRDSRVNTLQGSKDVESEMPFLYTNKNTDIFRQQLERELNEITEIILITVEGRPWD